MVASRSGVWTPFRGWRGALTAMASGIAFSLNASTEAATFLTRHPPRNPASTFLPRANPPQEITLTGCLQSGDQSGASASNEAGVPHVSGDDRGRGLEAADPRNVGQDAVRSLLQLVVPGQGRSRRATA